MGVGAILSKLFSPPFYKRSTPKGKNLLPKLFPFREDPFQKELRIHESKQEMRKAVYLVNDCDECTKCIQSF